MSLIDEALKRAASEAARRDAAKGVLPPFAPPLPLPDRRRPLWPVWAAAGVVLLAAGGLLLRRGSDRRAPEAPRAARPAARSTAPASPTGTATPSRSPTAAAAARPPVSSGMSRSPSPGRTQVRAAAAVSPSPSPVRELPQAVVTPAAALPLPDASGSPRVRSGARPTPAPTRPRLPAQTFGREAALPGGGKLELGGIVFSAENPVALINGRVVGPGSFVDGFEVVRIEETQVELEGEGRRVILQLR